MTVTVYPIGGQAYRMKYDGELPLVEAQKIVGGYVECCYSSARESNGSPIAIMVLNEEGKLRGLPINYPATAIAHRLSMITPKDYIVGAAVLLTGKNRWT